MVTIRIGPRDALIVVDLQVDFCPGGALAVPEGDRIVPAVNRLLGREGWMRVATRDWHPADHVSFRERGGLWPPHCVAGTPGAEFHPELRADRVDRVVSKAAGRDEEAYSGFEGTSLASDLKAARVERIFVCGLATDYCVRATALDGRRTGLEVIVLEDAIRAVEVSPGDGEKAEEEMRRAGCAFASSADLEE